MHSRADRNVTKTVTNRKRRFGPVPSVARRTRSAKDEARDLARVHFLFRLATLRPRVLITLAAIKPDDRAAVDRWLLTWQLPPWVLDYALDTLALWRLWPRGRARVWSFNRTNASGEWLPETGRPAKRPADLVISERHFDWLIAHQHSGSRNESVFNIAISYDVNETTVRRAVDRLARLLSTNHT